MNTKILPKFKFFLAVLVVVMFYILTFALMKITIPKDSNQVVFMLFGSISTAFGTIIAYYFGSSQGSEDKNKILNNKGDK